SAFATRASSLFLRHECNWNIDNAETKTLIGSARDDYTFEELVSRTESEIREEEFPLFHNSLSLNLDEHLGRNQPAHFDDNRGRANVGEKLAVCASDFLPLVDILDVHAGLHDIL